MYKSWKVTCFLTSFSLFFWCLWQAILKWRFLISCPKVAVFPRVPLLYLREFNWVILFLTCGTWLPLAKSCFFTMYGTCLIEKSWESWRNLTWEGHCLKMAYLLGGSLFTGWMPSQGGSLLKVLKLLYTFVK